MSSNTSNLWALVATFSTLGFVVAVSLALYLIYRKRILEEWETMRINGLKCRYAFSKISATLTHFNILMYTATQNHPVEVYDDIDCVCCDRYPSCRHLMVMQDADCLAASWHA